MLETTRLRVSVVCLGLVALMGLSFAYTLSCAGFPGVPFVRAALGLLSTRRRMMRGALLLLIIASPLIVAVLPKPVSERIVDTFEPEAGQPTVKLGCVAFDPSTSARFICVQQALED